MPAKNSQEISDSGVDVIGEGTFGCAHKPSMMCRDKTRRNENEISKLNDLIERLKAVNGLLDAQAVLNLNSQQLNDLSNTFLPVGSGDFPPYKGFKFKIKELSIGIQI